MRTSTSPILLLEYGLRIAVFYFAFEMCIRDSFLGAHSILLSSGEEALLAASRSMVCHCPFSNCGKGAPDTPQLLELSLIHI